MSRHELQKTVKAALADGLDNYDADELAAAINSQSNVKTAVDREMAAAILDGIRANQDALAVGLADEIAEQVQVSQPTLNGQPVSADGGSIISETTRDTIIVGAMILDGFMIGTYAGSGEDIGFAIAAAGGLAVLLADWFRRKYDLSVEPATDS